MKGDERVQECFKSWKNVSGNVIVNFIARWFLNDDKKLGKMSFNHDLETSPSLRNYSASHYTHFHRDQLFQFPNQSLAHLFMQICFHSPKIFLFLLFLFILTFPWLIAVLCLTFSISKVSIASLPAMFCFGTESRKNFFREHLPITVDSGVFQCN